MGTIIGIIAFIFFIVLLAALFCTLYILIGYLFIEPFRRNNHKSNTINFTFRW